jgi:flagellar basal body-associated protein FliL
MRGLLIAVVTMGVLIVVGTVALLVAIAQRLSSPAAPSAATVTLEEPAGAHIVGMTGIADRIAVRLQGGGPDRVVVIDLKTGKPVARIGLGQ